MKRTIFMKTAIICLLLGNVALSNAQVTIGSAEVPKAGALLQLKELTGITDDGANAHRGLALPRVTLSDRNNLFPMFLNDPNDPESGPNAAYAANKEMLDRTHVGLIVFNIVEDKYEDLCPGLNIWNGEEWNCLQERMGNATFSPVSCSDITVNGAYVEDSPLTSGNFLTINLNVIRSGAFSIIARTDNGYNFFLSGVALDAGALVVNIPGQGTPENVGIDVLEFTGIQLENNCEVTVEVQTPVATYALNCASVRVTGTFVAGQVPQGATITIGVTVTTAGSYYIYTPATYGIRFVASGVFPAPGTYTVTLQLAEGSIPTRHLDFPIAILANTPFGNARCYANIPMTLPAMTFGVIGAANVYTWNNAPRRAALGSTNFGPDGRVKILGLTAHPGWGNGLTSVAAAETALTNALNPNHSATPPDIILFFAHPMVPSANLSNLLAQYIQRGGVVIYSPQDGGALGVNNLMYGLFGMRTAIAQSGAATGSTSDDQVYRINILHDCPIINGPFGNLGGMYWGEDNAHSGSIILTALPPGSVQIATARSVNATGAGRPPQHSIVWYNDFYNFVYFGDSNGASTTSTSATDFPTLFYDNGVPRSKFYGLPVSGRRFVVNSALELNAVAWGLRKAAVSGINPH